MNNYKIFGGLIDGKAEIFQEPKSRRLFCAHDFTIYEWPNFPRKVIRWIRQDMLKHPDALECLGTWENLVKEDRILRYTLCRFGGIDDKPDFNERGEASHSEYFECGLRGKCRFEGKLCCSIKVDNGFLTKSELEVMKYIRLPAKIIASKMNLSGDTISTHLQNIRRKTGMNDKVNLAVFAAEKGITLYKPDK